MPRDVKKVHDLRNMTINEVSLVTEPACPEADIILMKTGHDVSDEPRDERGRWTTWGPSDLVRGAKGATRELVRSLSDRAKKIGETVVSRTISGVRTTRPTGAFPVHGGGVQFDFEHTLNREGAKYFSSVQIRPEHVAGESRAHRTLQRGLAVTHDILRRSNRQTQNPFGSSGARFNWFSGRYQPGGSWSYGSSSSDASGNTRAPVPVSTSASRENFISRGKFGMPVYRAPELPPRDWGGSADATYYRGVYVPAARKDVQQGIKDVLDWAAQNPTLAAQARSALTRENTATGAGFFTEEGDYVPPSNVIRQDNFIAQYNRARDARRTRATSREQETFNSLFTHDTPVTRVPPGHAEGGYDASSMQEGSGTGHRAGYQRLDKSLFPSPPPDFPITRCPAAHAVGGFRAEEYIGKGPTLAPFLTSATKSRGRGLDYVQRVAKSKIKRK